MFTFFIGQDLTYCDQARSISYTWPSASPFIISLHGLSKHGSWIPSSSSLTNPILLWKRTKSLKFRALKLFTWRHLVNNSVLLFNILRTRARNVRYLNYQRSQHNIYQSVLIICLMIVAAET